MKKYLYIIFPAILFIFSRCSKDHTTNPVVPVLPSVSFQSINYPSFINSSWTNVLGGTVAIEFDLLNSSNTVTSTFKDSTALNNISAYSKILSAGTYNIYVASKSTAVADTFVRFNAQIKSLSISNKQALSLTATTNDGLITIGQSFVQSGTVPSFKSDSAATPYKFGYTNGFYYLYVKGGTKGTVSFTTKGNQTVTKSLSIVTLNQYNLALQTNNGTLQVVFAPFAYNQVAVSSSTLLTVNANPTSYGAYASVYFVVTDENGKVLNSVKYIPGTTTFTIASLQPFAETRFNFFEIEISAASANTKPNITGFLQVKKGSVYTPYVNSLPGKPGTPNSVKIHLTNSTGFDQLNLATDMGNYSILHSLADTTSIIGYTYSTGSKLWVQMLKNNQYVYQFFNIPNGTTNFNVDISQLTETPAVQTMTAPGSNFQVSVFAKPDVNYANEYYLGQVSAPYSYNTLNYYYPSEPFAEYDALMSYTIGKFDYTIITAAAAIPAQVPAFNASFNIPASTLANFVPNYTGTFDFYEAVFANTNSTPNVQFVLYSPSAANYTNIKLPDFSSYLGLASLDLSQQVLTYFGLYQTDGFNEANFYYLNALSNSSKAVYSNY